MKHTKQDCLVATLRSENYAEITKGSKYRDFRHHDGRVIRVGKNGALQIGRKLSATNSLTDTQLYWVLVRQGKKILEG